MAVRNAGPRSDRAAVFALRARWRTASIASGWRFPSDWGVPEVDAVCTAVVGGGDAGCAFAELARARALAGASLDETLTDLAALHAVTARPDGLVSVDPNAAPAPLIRSVALAWADAALGGLGRTEATETLTGLATESYLRTRFAELYRRAGRDGTCPSDTHVLLTVSLDLSRVVGWPRLMAMVLVADVLRDVFDGGESLAALGPSVAVVLSDRSAGLADRSAEARWLIADRLAIDPDLRPAARPEFRVERMPSSEAAAQQLLTRVARA